MNMENREEQVKETQKELKEANKLAANVASGNVLGATKNAMNLSFSWKCSSFAHHPSGHICLLSFEYQNVPTIPECL